MVEPEGTSVADRCWRSRVVGVGAVQRVPVKCPLAAFSQMGLVGVAQSLACCTALLEGRRWEAAMHCTSVPSPAGSNASGSPFVVSPFSLGCVPPAIALG